MAGCACLSLLVRCSLLLPVVVFFFSSRIRHTRSPGDWSSDVCSSDLIQAHVERLPVSYFDSTQTGKLISRIMNDAEGVRNLVGSGIVQLIGSSITAIIAI